MATIYNDVVQTRKNAHVNSINNKQQQRKKTYKMYTKERTTFVQKIKKTKWMRWNEENEMETGEKRSKERTN